MCNAHFDVFVKITWQHVVELEVLLDSMISHAGFLKVVRFDLLAAVSTADLGGCCSTMPLVVKTKYPHWNKVNANCVPAKILQKKQNNQKILEPKLIIISHKGKLNKVATVSWNYHNATHKLKWTAQSKPEQRFHKNILPNPTMSSKIEFVWIAVQQNLP